jgi:dTMP kinase
MAIRASTTKPMSRATAALSGRLITVEGIDGAGKSTHLPWLREVLERSGHRVWATREPGGTPLGERLRELLLSEPMTQLSETLLMFAARREHCETAIWPRLDDGTWVVCDRFTDATYAYQGGGYGVAMQCIEDLERTVLGEFRPHLTLVFDLPVAVSRERLRDGRTPDKFERKETDFFERVRATYLARAAAESKRCIVIDATRSITEVRAAVASAVNGL